MVWRVELVKKVMECVVGELRVESLGLRVERVERIWLNFWVEVVVMVVVFIIEISFEVKWL